MNATRVFTENLHSKILVEFELAVSPDLALTMLRQNKQNRDTKETDITFFTEEILAGRWANLADGVAFDSRGVLVDGQHRLMAIIKAGRTVTMKVAFGLSPESRIAVDVRSRVSDSSLLEADGFTHGDMRAAVAKLFMVYVKFPEKKLRRFSMDDVVVAVKELQPELDYLASHYRALSRMGLRAPLLFALTMGLRKDRPGTVAFTTRLVNFERRGPNDPAVKFEHLAKPEKGRSREALLQAGLRCIRAALAGEELERVRTAENELQHFVAA